MRHEQQDVNYKSDDAYNKGKQHEDEDNQEVSDGM